MNKQINKTLFRIIEKDRQITTVRLCNRLHINKQFYQSIVLMTLMKFKRVLEDKNLKHKTYRPITKLM